MANIYDQHQAAFAQVSAHAILKDGQCVATVAFKYPRDGAGRLYAYVHWNGIEMVRGFATGGGYDKHSAACASAAKKFYASWRDKHEVSDEAGNRYNFFSELAKDHGARWDNRLIDAGFTVVSVV